MCFCVAICSRDLLPGFAGEPSTSDGGFVHTGLLTPECGELSDSAAGSGPGEGCPRAVRCEPTYRSGRRCARLALSGTHRNFCATASAIL